MGVVDWGRGDGGGGVRHGSSDVTDPYSLSAQGRFEIGNKQK